MSYRNWKSDIEASLAIGRRKVRGQWHVSLSCPRDTLLTVTLPAACHSAVYQIFVRSYHAISVVSPSAIFSVVRTANRWVLFAAWCCYDIKYRCSFRRSSTSDVRTVLFCVRLSVVCVPSFCCRWSTNNRLVSHCSTRTWFLSNIYDSTFIFHLRLYRFSVVVKLNKRLPQLVRFPVKTAVYS